MAEINWELPISISLDGMKMGDWWFRCELLSRPDLGRHSAILGPKYGEAVWRRDIVVGESATLTQEEFDKLQAKVTGAQLFRPGVFEWGHETTLGLSLMDR